LLEVRLGIFDLLPNCFQDMARNSGSDRFGIDEQQPYFSRRQPRKVDNANAATLTRSRTRPPYFSTPTTLRDDFSSIWISCEPSEKFKPLLSRPQLVGVGGECRCLHACVHRKIVRQRRMPCYSRSERPNAAAQPAPQAVGCSGMLSVHVDKFASGMRLRDR